MKTGWRKQNPSVKDAGLSKTLEANAEMQVADALDSIRTHSIPYGRATRVSSEWKRWRAYRRMTSRWSEWATKKAFSHATSRGGRCRRKQKM